jgi:hypothetical protein
VAATFISLRRLIHEADIFDGKRVTVIAYYDAREGPSLRVSSRATDPNDRVLVFPPATAPEGLEGTFVLVEGFFGKPDATSQGLGGHIGDVVRFEPWSDPVKALGGRRPNDDDVTEEQALRELIEAPGAHDRELVRVAGFAAVRFEQHALFVSEEAYLNRLSKDAIWLAGSLVEPRFHEQRVVVLGTFDARKRGHLSVYSGTISVATCAVIERRQDDKVEGPQTNKHPDHDAWSPPSIPIPGYRRQ